MGGRAGEGVTWLQGGSLYGFWDSGLAVGESDCWGLYRTCQDCQLVVPELREKLTAVREESKMLAGQKSVLQVEVFVISTNILLKFCGADPA